ncbi:MAG: hypothetical protein AAF961_12205, partial [Planctomycetota bacterium]
HVERVLQSHRAVAQAAVVGAPDDRWGESGWAFLKLQPRANVSEADIHAWCRERLAGFQCPASLRILDELPLGPSGKVDKLSLKRIAAAAGGKR